MGRERERRICLVFGFAAAILKCDCGKHEVAKVSGCLSFSLSLSVTVSVHNLSIMRQTLELVQNAFALHFALGALREWLIWNWNWNGVKCAISTATADFSWVNWHYLYHMQFARLFRVHLFYFILSLTTSSWEQPKKWLEKWLSLCHDVQA